MPMAWRTSALWYEDSASALRRQRGGGVRRLMRERLRQQCQADQKHCADERRNAHPRVERKADGDIERQPGHIQKCYRARARQERAHLIEIANGLESVALSRGLQGETRNALICAQAQTLAK